MEPRKYTAEIRKRSIEEYTQPKGPIRFTEWQQFEIDCIPWYQWFENRGIPAAIIKRSSGREMHYAVLRNWRGNQPVNPEWAKTFNIVVKCNGFE